MASGRARKCDITQMLPRVQVLLQIKSLKASCRKYSIYISTIFCATLDDYVIGVGFDLKGLWAFDALTRKLF